MRKLLKITISLVFLFGVIQINANTNSEKKEKVTQEENEIETPQNSQDKDKYLKTIEFIKGKTKRNNWYGSNTYNDYTIKVSNCTLYVSDKTFWDGAGTITYDSKIDLKMLNPNDIKINSHNKVTLYTTGKKNLVSVNCSDGRDWDNFNVGIGYNNEDDARRVAKAFKWLIEYCGGEDEMYNASKAKQSSSNNKSSYNPCDNFSFEELSRGDPVDFDGWVATNIYIRTNDGTKLFVEQIVFDSGGSIKYCYNGGNDYGRLYDAVKNAVGCD